MIPTIGRIVHYHYRNDDNPEALVACPAIITQVLDEFQLFLTLFEPGKVPRPTSNSIMFSNVPHQNHWTWPPRV